MDTSDLESALARVRLAAFDVDGVFTDGTFVLDGNGVDSVRFDTRDGLPPRTDGSNLTPGIRIVQ